MGWFGPRGLASIVLGLVYLEATHRAGGTTIPLAVMATVLLSIFAHGLSAVPGIAAYARRVATLEADAPEHDRALDTGAAPVSSPPGEREPNRDRVEPTRGPPAPSGRLACPMAVPPPCC